MKYTLHNLFNRKFITPLLPSLLFCLNTSCTPIAAHLHQPKPVIECLPLEENLDTGSVCLDGDHYNLDHQNTIRALNNSNSVWSLPCDYAQTQQSTLEPQFNLNQQLLRININVSVEDQLLHLDGELANGETCTFLEQRVITGKKDWETPYLSSEITHAFINPAWYPTNHIWRENLTHKYLPQSLKRIFIHSDGRYMVPGKDNPLGKVKFGFKNNYSVTLHGTNDKHLFLHNSRHYSSGCVRTEDEVYLLKVLNQISGNTNNYNPDNINDLIDSGNTHRLDFITPIYLNIAK